MGNQNATGQQGMASSNEQNNLCSFYYSLISKFTDAEEDELANQAPEKSSQESSGVKNGENEQVISAETKNSLNVATSDDTSKGLGDPKVENQATETEEQHSYDHPSSGDNGVGLVYLPDAMILDGIPVKSSSDESREIQEAYAAREPPDAADVKSNQRESEKIKAEPFPLHGNGEPLGLVLSHDSEVEGRVPDGSAISNAYQDLEEKQEMLNASIVEEKYQISCKDEGENCAFSKNELDLTGIIGGDTSRSHREPTEDEMIVNTEKSKEMESELCTKVTKLNESELDVEEEKADLIPTKSKNEPLLKIKPEGACARQSEARLDGNNEEPRTNKSVILNSEGQIKVNDAIGCKVDSSDRIAGLPPQTQCQDSEQKEMFVDIDTGPTETTTENDWHVNDKASTQKIVETVKDTTQNIYPSSREEKGTQEGHKTEESIKTKTIPFTSSAYTTLNSSSDSAKSHVGVVAFALMPKHEKPSLAHSDSSETNLINLAENKTTESRPRNSTGSVDTEAISEHPSIQTRIQKSPSFNFDFINGARKEESDQTPLLYQSNAPTRRLSSPVNIHGQDSLELHDISVEEKTIILERSDSEKSRRPFLSLPKLDEEARLLKHQGEDSIPIGKTDLQESHNGDDKEVGSKGREKRKPRPPSFFSGCICCSGIGSLEC
ncbi:hypothetical protein Nepgr_010322 [Nepenthes gracilis]|uniref:Uncharacterized protein n=1 Tax=Nepenthes gracilis TaxID=150966 RepID=A0AAD3SCE5_NEPGR|nr:hypothetical protein Nepgr_010322 [Nepenthes gracilis]